MNNNNKKLIRNVSLRGWKSQIRDWWTKIYLRMERQKKQSSLLWDRDYRLQQAILIRKSKDNWLNKIESEFVDKSIRARNLSRIKGFVKFPVIPLLFITGSILSPVGSPVRDLFAKTFVNGITNVYKTVVGAQEYVYPYIYPRKIQGRYKSVNTILPITKISCKLDYEHNPGSLPPINSSWQSYACTTASRISSGEGKQYQYIGIGSFDQKKSNSNPSISHPVFVGQEKSNDRKFLVIYPKGAFSIGDFTELSISNPSIPLKPLKGPGECKYLAGDIYQGQISNNQRNDLTKKATAYFADNQSLWEGEFINDKPGSGKYLIPPIQ